MRALKWPRRFLWRPLRSEARRRPRGHNGSGRCGGGRSDHVRGNGGCGSGACSYLARTTARAAAAVSHAAADGPAQGPLCVLQWLDLSQPGSWYRLPPDTDNENRGAH